MKKTSDFSWQDLKVCVQLPVYNEPADHMRGLLLSCVKMRWSREQLVIQVLDDSTDPLLLEALKRTISQIKNTYPDVILQHVRRAQRIGYKAGALEYGRELEKADFYAILDCDFRPPPHFLERSISELMRSSQIAFVQWPWSFVNKSKHLLTTLQSTLLGMHFFVEHRGRYCRDLFFNFNGTAGVWRADAIEQAGGWTSQSVTEDLLLSAKSFLGGYKHQLLTEEHCDSELPMDWRAYMIQQRRWALGTGQSLRALWSEIWSNQVLSRSQKLDMVMHFVGYAGFSLVVLSYFLSPYWIYHHHLWLRAQQDFGSLHVLSIASWVVLLALFFVIFLSPQMKVWPRFSQRLRGAGAVWLLSPLIFATVLPAYWQGLLQSKKKAQSYPFHRTPKQNVVKKNIPLEVIIFHSTFIIFNIYLAYSWQMYLAGGFFTLQFVWWCKLNFDLNKKDVSIYDEALAFTTNPSK